MNVDYQSFPNRGQLARQMNFSLDCLWSQIGCERGLVYAYVIATIENQDSVFVQTGSGPNFQGGLITLCSCKHFMRTFRTVENWSNTWVAGFTGIRATEERKNALVYLMKVSNAFASHRDLWYSSIVPLNTKRTKAAHLNSFGDIYKPKNKNAKPYREKSYHPPRADHVHMWRGIWRKDIDYIGQASRRPALLMGDPTCSFLWNASLILSRETEIGRPTRKWTLNDFLRELSPGRGGS